MESITYIKVFLTSIATYLINLINPSINLLEAFGWAVAVDFVVGMFLSYKKGIKFDPRKAGKKLGHLGLFILVLFASIQTNPLWAEYGLKHYTVANWIISSYGIWHFFSILQNAGDLGLPMASYIQKLIESKSEDLKNINKKEGQDETKQQ